jgi:hypothetical protein
MKMTTKQAQREAVIDAPKQGDKLTLYPATFGLLEWLQSKRKNPLICGGKVELKHVAEVCYAFTMPSLEVVRIPDAKLKARIDEFMHTVTPASFHEMEKHAERELLKFQKTSVSPKKSQAAPIRRKR